MRAQSVPKYKDALASQGVLCLDDVFSEVLAVVTNLSPHIVDKEWLREVVFVVRVGHGLEVKSHGSAALDITDLEATSCRVRVDVEEASNFLTVLREERVIQALLPLLVEVHDMVGLRAEQSAKSLIGKKLVKDIDFVNSGLSALVSDAGSSDKSSGNEMNLPQRSMGKHHEAEAAISEQ